ncbi:MAG: hypothetical protein CL613_01960 [Aquimarina sp.]|nr:hypothetical protein [Aquimarina sp.]
MNQKRKRYKKKRYVVPILIISVLIIARLLLPYFVKKYVNKTLAEIPGYYGQVEDIDISLIRGAYVIENLYLNKISADSEVPFLTIAKSDISIEWESLFSGKIVSEIILTTPKVIYVFEDQQKTEGEDPDVEDWSKALTDLVPIEINRLEVHNGTVAFVQLSADPNIDLNVHNIELEAKNLRNVVRSDKNLPSTIQATAVSIGQGDVKLDGRMDLVKQVPDMDLSLSLENGNARALNDFTKHYAGIDFASGKFNIYTEVAIADSYLKGYIKPMLVDTKMIGKDDGFLGVLWEGFVGFFKFILKNHKKDSLATKVPIEGDLSKTKAKILPTVLNIFKNGWIKAFENTTDQSIDFEDALKGKE